MCVGTAPFSYFLWTQELFEQTEALLDKWKHPEPFRPATAPGGEIILPQPYRLQMY